MDDELASNLRVDVCHHLLMMAEEVGLSLTDLLRVIDMARQEIETLAEAHGEPQATRN